MIDLQRYRFTDIDVRNNDELVDAAYKYLELYNGEFEFLISCKMRVQQGIDLSIGMVRGVLNCMRADPRVKIELEDEEIVNMTVQGTRTGRIRHTESNMEEVERPLKTVPAYHPPVSTVAKIKVPFVNAKNSFIFHDIKEAYFVWRWDGPILYVKPVCVTQRLKNPYLLDERDMMELKQVNGEELYMRVCSKCLKLRNG